MSDSSFRMYRGFNEPEVRQYANATHRVGHKETGQFTSNTPQDRVARALASRKAIALKELLESFEFYDRVHKRVRATEVADLCCGHGLTGLLFALLDKQVERVTLLDRRRPKSHQAVLEAVCEVGPWVADKVRYLEGCVERAEDDLTPGTAIIGVHACGVITDRCLDTAIALGGPVAVMPCCYFQTWRPAPQAVRDALGPDLATDIHRTYRLEAAGYRVDWSFIPKAITPMNRILVGWHPQH